MVNSTRTSSAIAHSSSYPAIVRSVPARASAMPLVIHEPIEPQPLTEAQIMREEVEALCLHMLWVRSWWQAHEAGIRAADRRAAGSIHDHIIDGALFARSIGRAAGFELDSERISNYAWGRSMQTMRVVVGGVQ